jgi:aspartokinase
MEQEEPSRLDILLDKKKISIALNLLKNCDFIRNVRQIVMSKPTSRISVIGSSVSPEVGKILTAVLRNKKIEVLRCSTANYKVNLIVSSDSLLEAITLLHKHCGLEK